MIEDKVLESILELELITETTELSGNGIPGNGVEMKGNGIPISEKFNCNKLFD